jgi:23S rRNA-/tRNA-specific pseudouridylate synthase
MVNCSFSLKRQVSSKEAGIRLLPFVRKHCSGQSSVKGLKRAIESKGCKINGRVETFSTRILSAGDVVELAIVPKEERASLTFLYEDKDLIVCDKPSGIVCEAKNFPYKLVHRLDKETSGVLILAKREEVYKKMVTLFSEKKVEKQYLALVDGEVRKKEGRIETRLSKKHAYQGQTIYGSSKKGEEAITLWKCLGVSQGVSLILCEPITGRTHQLRVHLKELGYPILGDYQYGKHFKSALLPTRHLLHALKISFPHPGTNKLVEVVAPLPKDFLEVLKLVCMAHLIEPFSH